MNEPSESMKKYGSTGETQTMIPISIETLMRLQGVGGEDEDSIDLFAVGEALWARRSSFFLWTLILAVLFYSFSYCVTPTFKAEVSLVTMESGPSSRLGGLAAQLGGLGGLGLLAGLPESKTMSGQLTIALKSRSLSVEILKRFPEVVEELSQPNLMSRAWLALGLEPSKRNPSLERLAEGFQKRINMNLSPFGRTVVQAW